MTGGLSIAVALDGAGWHPAAWREPDARPDELFTAGYWRDLVSTAQRGLLDFVTIEDSLAVQSGRFARPDERIDRVRGRLDAVLLAARIAPQTAGIGLVPTATTTHTEPFHVSKAIATLDYVSTGRAGVRLQVSPGRAEAANFGRRTVPELRAEDLGGERAVAALTELFDEAADFAEVLRRLWDSWEDDAIIKDVSTGRYVDRNKLHYIDFDGPRFQVRGPSITPRPPQGQPLVTALAHAGPAYRLAARAADLVFVTPSGTESLGEILTDVRAAERATGRTGEPLRIFADIVVFLDGTPGGATARKARLDELDGAELHSDAHVFTGTATELADLLVDWHQAGVDGFRLRPGALPHDLTAIAANLTAELRARGVFRDEYGTTTLRGRIGLDRPGNRYAA